MKKYWLFVISLILLAASSYAQVTITKPANGATVSSPINVVASAKSTTGYAITSMKIYIDSVSQYTVKTSTVNASIPVANGSHNVTVVAWDSSGKSYSQAETITVGTPSPTSVITVYSPANGTTVGSPVTFSAKASSGNSATPITSMKLYVDSVSKFTTSSASINTSFAVASGTHNVTWVAWDSTGKSYTQNLSINVPGTSPTPPPTTPGKVTITSPTAGSTVNSPTQFTASATPATGTTIASMTLYVDGVSKYTTNSAALSTSQSLASGAHTILVKALDSAGASYQSSESITVSAPTPAAQHLVTVDWTENSTNVAGFNVYRKAAGATAYTKITPTLTTATTYRDTNVTAGATYTYVVTAVNSSGYESGYSAPASATVPTP